MFEKSYIEKCLEGEATVFQLDEYVERWHESDIDVSLQDYLGLTQYEYEMWGKSSDSIFRDIIRCRREGIRFEDYRGMNEEQRLAARSYDYDAVSKMKDGIRDEEPV